MPSDPCIDPEPGIWSDTPLIDECDTGGDLRAFIDMLDGDRDAWPPRWWWDGETDTMEAHDADR